MTVIESPVVSETIWDALHMEVNPALLPAPPESASGLRKFASDVAYLARWRVRVALKELFPATSHSVRVSEGRTIMAGDAAFEQNVAYVKSRVSCLDVAILYGVEMQASGGEHRGPCPVHGGENPTSFCVYKSESAVHGIYDRWSCHSCGESGDVLDLAGKLYPHGGGGSRPDWAMEALADEFGLTLIRDEDFYSEYQIEVERARKKARKAFGEGLVRHYFEREVEPLIRVFAKDEDEREKLLDSCLRSAGLWNS